MMNTKRREEILAAMQRAIEQGFEDEEEIFESTFEMFYQEGVDEAWFRQQLSEAYQRRLAEEQSWPTVTHFDLLAQVFDRLGKDGILALHNAGATRQDGTDDAYQVCEEAESAGFHPVGYCYYHSQDIDHAIEDHQLWIGFGDFDEDQAQQKAVGKVVAHRLWQEGFQVAWNEDPEQRILVTGIVRRKRHDDQDFSYSRAVMHLA